MKKRSIYKNIGSLLGILIIATAMIYIIILFVQLGTNWATDDYCNGVVKKDNMTPGQYQACVVNK